MQRETIVVVEDEPDILEIIEYNLAREGFRVVASTNGEEGLRRVRSERPALVLLDLMLPGMNGLDICRRLKEESNSSGIPIIMVSAKGEESDIVLGLGIGADDYVTKPFSPKELIARVKAVIRRGAQQELAPPGERLVFGDVTIDAGRHEVTVEGEAVEFTATEFRLLYFLASHPGRVFTRDQLIRRVIGEDVVVLERNIDVHIRSVRKKLGPHRDLVKTIRGVGYRFVGGEG